MSLNESGRHSLEFMLKAVERLEAGEHASALAIELNLRMIVHHWRNRHWRNWFRAGGAEALTSKRGCPRTPEVPPPPAANPGRPPGRAGPACL